MLMAWLLAYASLGSEGPESLEGRAYWSELGHLGVSLKEWWFPASSHSVS